MVLSNVNNVKGPEELLIFRCSVRRVFPWLFKLDCGHHFLSGMV